MRRAISCVYCDPKSRMRTSSRFTDTVSPRGSGALVLGEHRADAVGEQAHQRRQLAGGLRGLERVAITFALAGAHQRAHQAALEQQEIDEQPAGAPVAVD